MIIESTFAISIFGANINLANAKGLVPAKYKDNIAGDRVDGFDIDLRISGGQMSAEAELRDLREALAAMSSVGVDDLVMYARFQHDGQCNLEFDSTFLKELADLGINFCVSCFQILEPESPKVS